MLELNILEHLDLSDDRVRSVHTENNTSITEGEISILNEVKEKEFGIDLIYFNTDKNKNSFPAIFLKEVSNFNDTTLKDIAETQRKIWNYKKVLFLYVYSDTEIRIYNCSERPLVLTSDVLNYNQELQKLEINRYNTNQSDKAALQELKNIFSRIAVDTGIIWTSEEAQSMRDKINLQNRVDKYLVQSLINASAQLQSEGLDIDFIHKIILRSLFLLYLEDRGATDERLYSQYKKGATSYFHILDDADATYRLYSRLEDDFNGNLFALASDEHITTDQLKIIKKCFISGYDKIPQIELFEDWRLFDFSIIQIELLSEIYENFLAETDPDLKANSGTYYTPPSLVEFILNEKLPVNIEEKEYSVKILDPSCGSGIFLVESFKRLVKRYENQHNKKPDFKGLVTLLKDNIFGIEIHPQAIKVAAFSLYLALVDNLDPKTLWQKKKHRLPYLINDPDERDETKQGRNLFLRDTISDLSSIEELRNFQLIVGNPPFGTKQLSETIANYCDKEGFAKEKVLPFMHKATQFAPNGEIALIFNTKVLTNTRPTYQNFRRWLLNECYVEKIFNFSILRAAKKNFGGQLFGGATGPISIIFYKKEQPEIISDNIAYYAPKTFVRSNIIDGLSIDSTDTKYLPREECQKPDSKIWKVAMWGGFNDWEFINNISEKYTQSINDFLQDNKDKYSFGSGLHAPSTKQLEKKQTFSPKKVINLGSVNQFYTLDSAIVPSNKVYRNINQHIFKPPYLLFKEGQKEKEFCASYIDYESYHTAYSISSEESNDFNLKLWCSLINSSFAKYYLSLTSASWGIERERIQSNETLDLPMILNVDERIKLKLSTQFDFLIESIKENDINRSRVFIEEKINKIILYDVLQISRKNKILIDDLINYSIDLFDKKEKSKALFPVIDTQPYEYAKILSDELNDFLDGQDLFVNATTYLIKDSTSPLMMVKLSHDKVKKDINTSEELIEEELKDIDRYLWHKEATNIYFRKKLNYSTGNDIYIIRPNQRRFWSKSMALEDASELILELLNGVHDGEN